MRRKTVTNYLVCIPGSGRLVHSTFELYEAVFWSLFGYEIFISETFLAWGRDAMCAPKCWR